MKISFDFSGFQAADSSEGYGTTYYGGEVVVNDKTYYCSGNDRGDRPFLDEIEEDLGLTENNMYELFDKMHAGEVGLADIDGDNIVFTSHSPKELSKTLDAWQLVVTLNMRKEQLEHQRKEHSKKLFDDGYEDDWGEGNEELGLYGGQISMINEVLKLVSEE